ncbi:parapinopsin-like isoform X2 [Planococcus citri]|uniref:parapinopsin-like isoform X2 n=1 Tax=Planococcus citri TaxID=170843 RepID=UPI0031F9F380
MFTNVSHRLAQDVKDLTSQQVSPTSYAVAACYMMCVTIFGILVNLMVFYIVLTDNKLRTPMNAILVNLACSDFGIAFLGNPVALFNAINGGWMLGQTVCQAYGFCMSFFASHLTWQGAMISIVGTWLASFVASSPPLFGWGAYENEAANISCSINWASREWNATSYILFLFSIAMIVPIFVITFSYYNIVKTMRQVNKMKLAQNTGVVKKAETHVARMILIMVIAFFIAWGPYAVFSLLIAFTDIEITPLYSMAPSLFAKSSVCYNPIIYFFLNHQFRKSWCRRIRKGYVEESSVRIRQIPLSKINSPPQELQNVEWCHRNQALMTITSSMSSSSSGTNSYFKQFKERDKNISHLIPYNTFPFVKRKQKLKSPSLPNITQH